MESQLRKWQQEALSEFIRSQGWNFLISAPPGVGKTVLGIEALCYRLDVARDSFVLILAPSVTVKRQWASKAAEWGTQLDPTFVIGNGIAKGMSGVAVTYQAMANPNAAEALATICRTRPTLVIADEIHHLGRNVWGQRYAVATAHATRRLGLSGSLFRTDGHRIPGVEYDKQGVSVADFTYSIGRATRDGALPLTTFHSFDGDMEWLSRNGRFLASFRDELPDIEASRRLRTSLDPSGRWLPNVLRRADERLRLIRAGDLATGLEPDINAGGLVVCIDGDHARAVAAILRQITGEDAVLVLHEEDDAQSLIKEFRAGRARWIVAVGMVSEGVDIPRLRVLTYATNRITFLSFLQVVGRLWRAAGDVAVYLPAEETLLSYAEKIDKQVVAALAEEEEQADEGAGGASDDRAPSEFRPIYAVERESDVIQGDDRLSIDEVENARKKNDEYGVRGDPVGLARLLRAERAQSGADPMPRSEVRRPVRAEYEDKEILLRKWGPLWQARVGFAKKLGKLGGVLARDGGMPYPVVNGRLKRLYGGREPALLTTGEIIGQIELCDEWSRALVDAQHAGEADEWSRQWQRGDWDGSADARVS